ncbi:MAG: UDP-N-acetylmuramate dehydrogenase [Coriobacteriia bacterium]|nr:UDP-N-acetylmuramate dehydrogenase [Coriobacteriia bacterium]
MTSSHESDIQALGSSLSAIPGVTVSYGVPLRDYTTLRIGGKAALWLEVETPLRDVGAPPDFSNIEKAVALCKSHRMPLFVMGSGSNILAPDSGYTGVIIKLARVSAHCEFTNDQVSADASYLLGPLVRDAAQRGWSDLEFLAGIPGTVGGALAMNAGTAHTWIDSVVRDVIVLEYGDAPRVVTRSVDDIEWGYRFSSLRDNALILAATFALRAKDEPDEVLARIAQQNKKRKRTQPLAFPNAGSVFRNPDGDSAGRLIEAVGLKGMKVGGAQISEVHANFIINCGNASTDDVLALIEESQQRVFEEYGIRLQKEIRVLGSEA